MALPLWFYGVVAAQVVVFFVLVGVVGLDWWIAAIIAGSLLVIDVVAVRRATGGSD